MDLRPQSSESRFRKACTQLECLGLSPSGQNVGPDKHAYREPDIAFLDIEMPGISGFDMINSVRVDHMPFVIFTTAYEKYAIDAFGANAIEYLLKPYSETQLAAAISRVRRAVHEHRLAELARNLLTAVGDVSAQPERLSESNNQRIAVKNAASVSFVAVRDIDRIEGADYYAKLHVAGRTHLVRESLASLAKRLESARFLRIHRSAIVNVDRVREIRSSHDGDSIAVLASGTKVPLALRRFIRVILACAFLSGRARRRMSWPKPSRLFGASSHYARRD